MSAPWRASVLTLFPEMFPGPLGLSLAGRGLETGAWELETKALRDFAEDRHQSVDDTPFGGGAGMVMRPDVVAKAIDSVPADGRPRLYLSPRGERFDQRMARSLADGPGVVVLCGRFEGVDQRAIDARDLREVSVGDFVLSGGEPAALVVFDACVRLLEGIVGSSESLAEESFQDDLLEYPQYTRPRVFEGRPIPDVLVSGHHGEVRRWRRAEAEKLTRARRPDLWSRHSAGPGGT